MEQFLAQAQKMKNLKFKKNFPNIKEPMKEDICYATTNRQMASKKYCKKL